MGERTLSYEVTQQMLNPKIRIISSNNIKKYVMAEMQQKNSGGSSRNTENYIEIGGRVEPSTKYYLQSYQFSESVNNFSGSFSFTVYEDVNVGDKDCIFSTVKNLDLVYIYENSEKSDKSLEKNNPVFIGVIHSKSIRSMINNGQVSRSTTIEGNGVYSLMGDLSVSLDIHTLTGINAVEVQTQFTSDVANITNYKKFVLKLWEYYENISKKVCGSGLKTSTVFIDEILGCFGMISDLVDIPDGETKYPVAASFWTQSVNKFADMLRTLFPSNIYEIFGHVNENGKPKITIREMPFMADKWKGLKRTEINPLYLTGYSINQSDSEVYNAFLAYIEGSPEDPSKYATLSAIENKIAKDTDKMAKYGYRPLQVNFRGYDISTAKNEDNKSSDTIAECTKKLMEWYGCLDDLYSGTISLVRGAGDTLPGVGERIKFINYEFYVTDKSHSWSYGNPVNVTLNISRGAYYNKAGERDTSGDENTKEKFGCRYAELTRVVM